MTINVKVKKKETKNNDVQSTFVYNSPIGHSCWNWDKEQIKKYTNIENKVR